MYLRFAILPCLICLVSLTVQAAELPTTQTSTTSYGDNPKRTDRYGDLLPPGAVFRIGTTRLRHHSRVIRPFENVLFSSNGKFVFSSARDEHEVRMWETATGREVQHFPARTSGPAFSLSAEGSLLAVSDFDEIHLYDTATGNKRRTISLSLLRAPFVFFLSFSADGKVLTVYHYGGSADTKPISRWETATGKLIGSNGMKKCETLHAFSADSRLAVSTCIEDKTIRLWETATGAKVREWKVGGEDPLGFRRLRFSPDGRHIVTGGEDTMIRVYETANGKEVRNWPVPLRETDASESSCEEFRISLLFQSSRTRLAVGGLAFAPDGQTLASVDRFNVLRLWDWKTGRELRYFKGVSGPVSFSPDGKILAAGGEDSRIRLWSTATGRDLCPFGDPGRITAIAFSPDGRVLAAGSDRGESRLFDADAGRELRKLPGYRLYAFSPKGGRLLVRQQEGDRLGPWCLLDDATGRECTRFGVEADPYCYFGGWDAENKLLLTCSSSSVQVCDTATGTLRREIRGHKDGDERYCSPDGRTVAMTGRQGAFLRLVASDTGEELCQLTGYSRDVRYDARRGEVSVGGGGIFRPVFSPNGKVLLAGCGPESLGLWDLTTGKQFLRLSCGQLLPHKPIFSPNSDFLTLLNPQGDPCLVDAATGRVRQRLAWRGGDLNWILKSVRAFSADGRLLAAAYDPQTLVLWEVATGRPIRIWPGHGRGQLHQMVFSSDSRRLATAGSDGTALVWDVMGLRPDGQLPERKLTPAETEQAWRDLADSDAAKAHHAIWLLVADPARALPLLRQRVHEVPAMDPRRLARLIADLNSDDFTVREKAVRELRKLDESARPALRAALKARASLEARRRVQGLLDDLDSGALPTESLRGLRAVAVLEHIGSAEARQLLDRLVGGMPEARLTREAKASLARLSRRAGTP